MKNEVILIEWINSLPFSTKNVESINDLLDGQFFSMMLTLLASPFESFPRNQHHNESKVLQVSLTHLHSNLESALQDTNSLDAIRNVIYQQFATDLLQCQLTEQTSIFLLELIVALSCISGSIGNDCFQAINQICTGDDGVQKREIFATIIQKFYPQPQTAYDDPVPRDDATASLSQSPVTLLRSPPSISGARSVPGVQSSMDTTDFLRLRLSDCQSQNSRLQADIQNLTEEKELISSENGGLRAKLLSAEEDLRIACEERDRLSDANTQFLLQTTGGDPEQFDQTQASFVDKQRENERKAEQQAIKRARQRADELTEMLVKAEAETRETGFKLASMEKTLTATQAELTALRKQNDIREKENLLKLDTKDITSSETERGRDGSTTPPPPGSKTNQAKQASDLLKLAERIQSLQKQLKDEKERRQDAEMKIVDISGQLQLHQSRMEQVEMTLRSHTKEKVNAETRAIEAERAQESLAQSLENANRQNQSLIEERDKLRETCDMLQDQVGDVMKRIIVDDSEEERNLQNLTETKRLLESKISDLESERGSIQAELDTLQQKNSQLQTKLSECLEKVTQTTNLQRQLREKDNLVQRVRTIAEEVMNENTLMRTAFFHLGFDTMQSSFHSPKRGT
ncbi:hypothetical protein BLNAU_396 [Blattamonas nauphoetae]|uniref:Uncharacterized protein n=1 Tax=Blattamonas nauphoetae TaxID=2049346 RepID=A0ABQ9YL48_9EUKA|nr:hypothetical protein BLNAU_396 [Blattamonas nauphoetae]